VGVATIAKYATHGIHRYSLADFGMAEAAVSRRALRIMSITSA